MHRPLETSLAILSLVGLPACGPESQGQEEDGEGAERVGRDDNKSAMEDTNVTAAEDCDACRDAVEVTGGTSLCARFSNGEVHCQPRDFRVNQRKSEVFEPTSIVDAIQLTAGYDHFCALRSSGQVVCWGVLGPRGDQSVTSDTPRAVEGLEGIARIVSGHEFYMRDSTCAQDGSGRVWCWGGWEFGFDPEPVAELDGISLLASTWGRRCGIRDASTLVCLGLNQGLTTRDLDLEAQPQQLALAWPHGCVRDAEGAVTCFKLDEEHEPFVPKLPASVALAASTQAVCSLSTRGEVHCVGEQGDITVQKQLQGASFLISRGDVCGSMPNGPLRCTSP